MKIVHLLRGKANPHTMNGVNNVVHHLATYQRSMGLDAEVWGIADTPEIRHEHAYTLRLFPRFPLRVRPGRAFRHAVNALDPRHTIVHMHSVFLPELFGAAVLFKRRGIRWVVMPHGGYHPQSMKKNAIAKRLYLQTFDSWLLRQATAVHANTEREGAQLRELHPDLRIVTIPNGQDLPAVRKTSADVRKSEGPTFVFCGRLSAPAKGLDLLLDGFCEYSRSGGAGRLWMIGDGEDRESLARRAKRLGVERSVSFLGALFGPEKHERLMAADLFIHTSRWEGMPTAVLEAASLALPLLISEATGLGSPVAASQAGFVLRENNAEAISRALLAAEHRWHSDGLRAMGSAARTMIQDVFSWRHVTGRVVDELYGAALG